MQQKKIKKVMQERMTATLTPNDTYNTFVLVILVTAVLFSLVTAVLFSLVTAVLSSLVTAVPVLENVEPW